ncbi:MAG TPA: hypothetical protein DCE41_00320 [Cytophagales bacterium]|nr:hypothetical protein [Cytophagales bacterium]HAA22927.1 hypothetical protein [Cytophagales bacterium]HAP62583.1 hypothetical protein [Cytophagales bacterium]
MLFPLIEKAGIYAMDIIEPKGGDAFKALEDALVTLAEEVNVRWFDGVLKQVYRYNWLQDSRIYNTVKLGYSLKENLGLQLFLSIGVSNISGGGVFEIDLQSEREKEGLVSARLKDIRKGFKLPVYLGAEDLTRVKVINEILDYFPKEFGRFPKSFFNLYNETWIDHASKKKLDSIDSNNPFSVHREDIQESDQWLNYAGYNNDAIVTDAPKPQGYTYDVHEKLMAQLIAHKKTQPALAIGLYGEWGSGKSHFMRATRWFIKDLADVPKDLRPEDWPYLDGVLPVWFNAWSYADSEIHANLMMKVWEEIENHLGLGKTWFQKHGEQLQQRMMVFADAQLGLDQQVESLNNKAGSLIKEIKGLAELEGVQQIEVDKATENLKMLPNELAVAQGYWLEAIRKTGEETWQAKAVELATKVGFEMPQGLQQPLTWLQTQLAQQEGSWSGMWRAQGRKLRVWLISNGVVLVTVLLLMVLSQLIEKLENLWTWIIGGGGSAFLVSIAGLLRRWKKLSENHRIQLGQVREEAQGYRKLAEIEHHKDLDDKQAVLKAQQAKLEAARNNHQIAVQELVKLRQNKRVLESQSQELQREIQEIKQQQQGQQQLGTFAKERLNDPAYQKRLGIYHVIRHDLEELSRIFNAKANHDGNEYERIKYSLTNEGEKGAMPLNRIILYIDDLDRCKTETVIRVLEAVHLLLAYPLFVVMVGADPFWVKKALEETYPYFKSPDEGIPKFNQSTPKGYLEKIFQIPFHISELDDARKSQLIRNILPLPEQEGEVGYAKVNPAEGHGGASGYTAKTGELKRDIIGADADDEQITEAAAKQLATSMSIKPSEHAYILEHIPSILGNNPRKIKRYVNLYRLVRAKAQLEGEVFTEEHYKTLAFLLAVSQDQLAASLLDKLEIKESHEKKMEAIRGWLKNKLQTDIALVGIDENLLVSEYLPQAIRPFRFQVPEPKGKSESPSRSTQD